MIHNVYHTRNFPPSLSEIQPPTEPLSVDTHEIFSYDSAAISDTSANHVLLGDINIYHPNLGGASVRPNHFSRLLLSLQELHDLSFLLPPETVTFAKHSAQSTIDLVFSSSSLFLSLMACRSRKDLDNRSDHYPFESTFLVSTHISLHVP